MIYNLVHGTHFIGALRAIFLSKEEHLTSKLLANLSGKVSTAISSIKRTNIGVCLFEVRVLSAGNSQVTHYVQ